MPYTSGFLKTPCWCFFRVQVSLSVRVQGLCSKLQIVRWLCYGYVGFLEHALSSCRPFVFLVLDKRKPQFLQFKLQTFRKLTARTRTSPIIQKNTLKKEPHRHHQWSSIINHHSSSINHFPNLPWTSQSFNESQWSSQALGHLRLPHQCPCDGDPLLLTTTELDATFTHAGVVAIGPYKTPARRSYYIPIVGALARCRKYLRITYYIYINCTCYL